jgi:hypothetical protein
VQHPTDPPSSSSSTQLEDLHASIGSSGIESSSNVHEALESTSIAPKDLKTLIKKTLHMPQQHANLGTRYAGYNAA